MNRSSSQPTSLDPGAAKLLEILADAQAKGTPALHEGSPEEARAMNQKAKELLGGEGPAMSTEALELNGSAGTIPARIYRPSHATELGPAIVYYHGGGWVIGGLDSYDGLCRELAERSRMVVISIDYRLAPEHRFPAAVDDALDALRAIHELAPTLGIDPRRIAIAGDSAGGNLAAVVALLARDAGGPEIAFQVLLYPATDMHPITDSHARYTEHLLTPASISWFQSHYMPPGAQIQSWRDDWRASPLRAANFEGLPPAYVLTAGFDPLKDEGLAYAEALEKAGNSVEYRCFDGQIHGFLTFEKVIPQSLEALEEIAAALRARFPAS